MAEAEHTLVDVVVAGFRTEAAATTSG